MCQALSKTLYPLLNTGSTQEDRKLSQHDCRIVNLDVNIEHRKNRLKWAVKYEDLSLFVCMVGMVQKRNICIKSLVHWSWLIKPVLL